MASTTDALGRMTTYEYDLRGNQVAVIQPLPGTGNAGPPVTRSVYDADGNLVQSVDALGDSTEYRYDALGQQDLVTQPQPTPTAALPQTQSVYDADGNETALIDPDGNVTTWTYNAQGQVTQSFQGQALAAGSGSTTIGGLSLTGDQRTFEIYVYFASPPGSGWQEAFSVSDSTASDAGALPITPATGTASPLGDGWYDLGSISLPSTDASTAVQLAYSGAAPLQVCLAGYANYDYYDAAGELTEAVDRDGRATTFQYDNCGRETVESWYPTSNTSGTPTETITNVYNAADLLLSATDENLTAGTTATDTYSYDAAGDVISETQQIPGLAPIVTLSEQYTAGNRTQLAVAIGGTNDFVNNYQYQGPAGQMSQVTQTGNGGNVVADKTATFQYDPAGELTGVGRYQNADATANLVAQATYGYDGDGDLTSLVYANGASTLPNYAWTYDAAGNMASASETLGNLVDSVSYANDSTGQLLSATATGGPPSESFSYDSNGNRETANGSTYATGPNNELLSDGIYNYTYDADGNCLSRTYIADGSQTLYTWDNRDRLTSVTSMDGKTVTQTVTYIYDAFNRWIGETIMANGTTTQTRYVYDGNQIIMQFDNVPSPAAGEGQGEGLPLGASSLSHRCLWGPAVDQLLADEQLLPSTSGGGAGGGGYDLNQQGQVVWTLTDNLNTVRDLATYDPGTGTTTVVNHRVFSAFGQLLSETNPATSNADAVACNGAEAVGNAATVDCLFAYTGRPLDTATGLQNNGDDWYNSTIGRWLGQDPVGLGPDTNPYRYCGNGPMDGTSPTGNGPANPTNPSPSNQDGPTWDPTFWNQPRIKKSNNCYSYALDQPYKADGTYRRPTGHPKPGSAAGKPLKGHKYATDLNAAALRDVFGVKPLPPDGVVPKGYHKIQAFYDPSPNGDYHWYRQDSNGNWSQKHGNENVSNVDASGNPITDPTTANNNYRQNENYSESCPVLIAPNR